MPCMWGYIIGKSAGVNSAPGAAWFETVEDARVAIDILIRVDGDAKKFWMTYAAAKTLSAASIKAALTVIAPIDEDQD